MTNARRRTALLIACAVALLVWATWTEVPHEVAARIDRPRDALRPPVAVRPRNRVGAPGAGEPTVEPPREMRHLALVDVGNVEPLAGVDVETLDGGRTTTDESGRFEAPAGSRSRLIVVSSGVRLLHPAEPLGGPTRDGIVLAWRPVRVEGHVTASDGTRVAGGAVVTAAPTPTLDGKWISDPERLGSARWFEVHARALARFPAVVDGTRFTAVVLACPAVTFVATAPGHLPTSVTLDLRTGVVQGPVDMVLQRQRRVRLRVTDARGNPLAGATAQYFCIRRGPIDAITPAVEMLVRTVARDGVAIQSNEVAGTADVAHHVQAVTDADGAATLLQPAAATIEFIIVWAPGQAPETVRPGDPRWRGESLDIVLSELHPASHRYRFLRGGTPIAPAQVAVLEEVEGFTPGRNPVPVDRDGYFSSDNIVPGRRYFVLIETARDALTGHVEFGTEADIETVGRFQ